MKRMALALIGFVAGCTPLDGSLHVNSPIEIDLNVPGGCAGAAAPAFPGEIKALDVKVYGKSFPGVFAPRIAPVFEQICSVVRPAFSCKLDLPTDRPTISPGDSITVEVSAFDSATIATAKLLAHGLSPRVLAPARGKVPVRAPVFLTAVGSTTSCPAIDLHTPRSHHTASLLCDGRVLVVGGLALATGAAITSGAFELYDPGTGTWSSSGVPAFGATDARSDHAAVSLCTTDPATGAVTSHVFIAGGFDAKGAALSSVLLWSDASPGTYRQLANGLNKARGLASAIAFSQTQVLVAGGESGTPGTYVPALDYELYDVAGQISVGATPFKVATARLQPGLASNPLTGSLVLCGGQPADAAPAPCEGLTPQDAALGVPPSCRLGPGTLLFGLGDTLVLAGAGVGTDCSGVVPTRSYAGGALVPGLKLLIAGGFLDGSGSLPDASMQVFDRGTSTSGPFGAMQAARVHHTMTTLNDGSVLVVGGNTNAREPSSELVAIAF